jgi:hypothetical protein
MQGLGTVCQVILVLQRIIAIQKVSQAVNGLMKENFNFPGFL